MTAGLEPPRIRMPAFGPGEWLNSDRPVAHDALRGQVVIVDFWDYSCVNCVRTFPYLRAWHRRYADLGLSLIGVHAPEFQFGYDPQQVRAAMADFGLAYPVLLDNAYETWDRYANHAWPTKYLIDARGYIRLTQQGEGGYAAFEAALQALLRERDATVTLPPLLPALRAEDAAGAVCYPTTPELYAGYETAGFFHTPGLGNPPAYLTDSPLIYELPEERARDRFYLGGIWRLDPEAVVFAGQADGEVRLRYRGIGVNAVLSWSSDPVALRLDLRPDGPPGRVELLLDGLPLTPFNAGEDVVFDSDGQSAVIPATPRMYHLVQGPRHGEHELILYFKGMGLALYTFTFTSCVVDDSL